MPVDDETKRLEELKTKVALLEAETVLLGAQKTRLEAEQALVRATDPTQAALNQANTEKAVAEAIRDSYRALLPQTTALEGTTTLDDKVLLESELLTYGKLEAIASTIATDLQGLNAHPLIVHGEREVEAVAAYQQFLAVVEVLVTEYERIIRSPAPEIKPPLAPLVAAAIAGVSAAIDVLGLLRQNVAITGAQFTVPEAALIALIASKLRDPVNIMYPALLPRSVDAASSDVLAKLKLLGDKKLAARVHVGPAKPKEDPVDPLRAELSEVDKLYAALLGALGKSDDKTGIGGIVGLLRGEALDKALGGDARLLFVTTIAARGSNRVRQSKIPFVGGVDHSGGAIVAYVVLKRDGTIVKSGLQKGYTGFVKAPQDRSAEKFP